MRHVAALTISIFTTSNVTVFARSVSQEVARSFHTTVIVALLQPPPEVRRRRALVL